MVLTICLATGGTSHPLNLRGWNSPTQRQVLMSDPESRYAEFREALEKGWLSMDALWRIIRHDEGAEWADESHSWARRLLFNQALEGEVSYAKINDSPEDLLVGDSWPLPPSRDSFRLFEEWKKAGCPEPPNSKPKSEGPREFHVKQFHKKSWNDKWGLCEKCAAASS